jgi:hypothetical protein
MDKAEKIRVLKKMIKYISKCKKTLSPVGFCEAYHAVIPFDALSNVFSAIPELLDYMPNSGEFYGLFWWNYHNYDKRIDILKEIIESLKK